MSKALGSIITLAGAVAVNVIPGLGQLASAAILLGSAALGYAVAALDRPPKPATATQAIKTERPPRISAYGRVRLFWAWILYETATDGWAVDVGVFHEGRLDAVETYYIGDKTVTVLSGGWVQKGPAGEWGNNDTVQVGVRLGLPTETAFSEVIAKVPTIWTNSHRGDGCATGFMLSKNVKAENYQTIYAVGGPDNATLSIVARAQRVFDWRDETQDVDDPDTWKWSENAVLATAHYYLVRKGKIWAKHFAPTLAYWTAAADDADSAMALKGGGTEPRYRTCVAHAHTDAHKDVEAHLLGCFDGWVSPRADGALVCYSGRYYEPTVTIGPDQIISYSLQEGVNEEDAVNTIKVTYVSAPHDYNTVDTDDWVDEDDVSARGKALSEDLANQTPSYAQNRRLAKRAMAKIMAPQRGTTTTTAAGRTALGQRYVRQQIIEGGIEFQDAVVEILKLTRNLRTGGVTYEWVLADPNIDAWNPATEEGDPASVGDRVAREPLEAPVITSAAFSTDDDSGDDSPGARIEIVVSGLDRDDVVWFARWRVVGGSIWNEQPYSDIDPGPSVTLLTGFVPVNATVEVEAAYQVGDGRISPWSDAETVTTALSIVLSDDGETILSDTDEVLIED